VQSKAERSIGITGSILLWRSAKVGKKHFSWPVVGPFTSAKENHELRR